MIDLTRVIMYASLLFYWAIYPRLYTLLLPPLSSLIIGVTFLNLAIAFTVPHVPWSRVRFSVFLFPALLIPFSVIWSYQFGSNTSLSYDVKALNNFCGLFLAPIFICLLQIDGPFKLFRRLEIIGFFYSALYCILTFLLPYIPYRQDSAAITFDPGRGTRLYQATALVLLLLIMQLYKLKSGRISIYTLFSLFLSVLTIILSQSRVASAACCLAVVAFYMGPVFLRFLARLSVLGMSSFLAVFLAAPEYFQSWMTGDPTLSIRKLAFGTAYTLIQSHWLVGFGMAGDPADYKRIFGYPYDPTDLGVVGVFAEFGLIGLASFGYICFILLKSITVKRLLPRQNMIIVQSVNLYMLIASFSSPSVLTEDSTILVSMTIGLVSWKRLQGRQQYRGDSRPNVASAA